ncbi:MAG: hypothetical protein MJZ37_01875 [Bacilli bacterium]|nr:hypothetical protein [Bacilli bacterium]
MQVENYLKTYQPIIYRTFTNALENDHLSHAYLLSGQPGTPLLETAKFLAKSILCDCPDPLACNNCITCLRIDDENYPDFFVFDGSKETIKKDAVNTIESSFEMKAFEAKGIRIYILHLIENMTIEAVNAILKFLEEPGSKIYAFLTTNNESAILPTIISRCQMMRLKLIDRSKVIEDAINLGVEEIDAEFLSYLFNDGELIRDKMDDEDFVSSYKETKNCVDIFLELLSNKNNNALIYQTDKKIVPSLKGKEDVRFFVDFLVEIFQDLLSIKHGNAPYLKKYDTILTQLANDLSNIDDKLLRILKHRSMVNLNVNSALLVDHLINEIVKE